MNNTVQLGTHSELIGSSPEPSPERCSEVGLSCENCTGGTARQLAGVCRGLSGAMVGQMFVQLYPSSACSVMHAHFAKSYREASQEVLKQSSQAEMPVMAEDIPQREERVEFERREVTFARPRVMAAYA